MDDEINEIRKRHLEELMAIDGVVGVGIGMDGEEHVIVVNVREMNEELLSKIPDDIEGVHVKVEVVGDMRKVMEDENQM